MARRPMSWTWNTATPDGRAWMVRQSEHGRRTWTPPSPLPDHRTGPAPMALRQRAGILLGRWRVRTSAGRQPLPPRRRFSKPSAPTRSAACSRRPDSCGSASGKADHGCVLTWSLTLPVREQLRLFTMSGPRSETPTSGAGTTSPDATRSCAATFPKPLVTRGPADRVASRPVGPHDSRCSSATRPIGAAHRHPPC
jgi:hypothetical protein